MRAQNAYYIQLSIGLVLCTLEVSEENCIVILTNAVSKDKVEMHTAEHLPEITDTVLGPAATHTDCFSCHLFPKTHPRVCKGSEFYTTRSLVIYLFDHKSKLKSERTGRKYMHRLAIETHGLRKAGRIFSASLL